MSIKAAFDRLGTWSVSGVTTNYGLDDVVGAIPQAQLPALGVFPGAVYAKGMQPFNINQSKAQTTVAVDHYLLSSGIALKQPSTRFYDLLALMDNYAAKVLADWTLNGNLLEPLTIPSIYVGAIQLGGVVYYGVIYHHQWVLQL
jgi:hypothetical protein